MKKGAIKYAYYEWDEEKWEGYKKRMKVDYFQHEEFVEAWDEFILYRSVIVKSPLTEYGAYTNLLELHRIALDDVHKAIASINYTVGSGKWTGLFEPKNYFKKYEIPNL